MENQRLETVQQPADVNSLRGKYHIGGGIKEPTRFDPIRYDDEVDSAKSYPSSSKGVNSRGMTEHAGVQAVNWAHDMRHSPFYLMFIVLSLLLTTIILVWAAILGPSVFENPAFLVLEFITLVAIAFNTVVEVWYVGGFYSYLCVSKDFTSSDFDSDDKNETDINYRPKTKGGTNCIYVLYAKYGVLCMNYFQLIVLVLAIAGFAVSVTATGESGTIEEEVTLGLLMTRYFAYILTLAISQYRTVSVQGGIDNVFRKAHFSTDDPIADDWDVKF